MENNQHTNDEKAEPVIEVEGIPLKRRLGFISGVAIIVGSIIAALVYAELGLMIPKSGCDFGYLLAAFGTFPAYMFTWTQLLVYPGGQVIKALTVAEYISKVLFDDCGPSDIVKKTFAVVALLSAGITNCISVRLVARIQILFTFLKLAGLVTVIVGGIVTISKGQYGSLTTGFVGTIDNPTSIASAVYSGLWAFDGWSNLNNVVEELKNPKRNLPLCIITSVLLVLFVYIMVNISYFTVLDKDEYLSSWAVAATWAEYVLPGAVIIIPITVACSVYGSMNSGGMIIGRIIFATAREGLFPEVLSHLNIHSNIPLPPTILIIILSLFMVVPSEIGLLLNLLGFLTWFFYGLGMLGHLILRYRMRNIDTDRKLRVPVIIPILVFLCCVYLVVAPFLEPVKQEFWYAVAYLAVGAVLYFPFAFFKLTLPGIDEISNVIQMLLNVAPPQQFKM